MSASQQQQAATAERRSRNLSMRLAGASWDLIAAQLGYSGKAAACKDFQRAMAATQAATDATATELRDLELLRLDRVQAGSWTNAMRGDHRAAETVLKCHDRRVRLLGLDAAARSIDNAVDAWLQHLGGKTEDHGGAGGVDLSPDDQAALAAVTA